MGILCGKIMILVLHGIETMMALDMVSAHCITTWEEKTIKYER